MKRTKGLDSSQDILFSLTQLVKDLIKAVEPDAKSKKVEIITHFSELLPSQVIGSKEQIYQLLENLLHYLLRHSNWGNIFLTIDKESKKRSSKNKIHICFTFQDSGVCVAVGNHPDKLEVNNLIHASFDDLKLFAIQQTVQSMKGTFNIEESNPNSTTLVLCLPFQIKSALEESEVEELPRCELDDSSQKIPCYKILVIEDDPICQNVFKVLLEELGCVSYIAGTARMGLQFLENKPDFLFVDIGLPDRDGMSLVKEMREKYQITVPIVATTASEWAPNQFVAVGFTEVLKKPISRDKVKHTLFRLLSSIHSVDNDDQRI